MSANEKQPADATGVLGRAQEKKDNDNFLNLFRTIDEYVSAGRALIDGERKRVGCSSPLQTELLDCAEEALYDLGYKLGRFLWNQRRQLAKQIVWEQARGDALEEAMEALDWHAQAVADSELAHAVDVAQQKLWTEHSLLDLQYWSNVHDEVEEVWFAYEMCLTGEDEGIDLERSVQRAYNARLREADGEYDD